MSTPHNTVWKINTLSPDKIQFKLRPNLDTLFPLAALFPVLISGFSLSHRWREVDTINLTNVFFPTWQHIRSWVGLWWRRRRWQLTDARDGIPSHEQPLLSRKVGMLFLSDNQCILYSTPNLCKFGFGCWFCCPASIFVFVSFLLVFPNMEWCRSVLSRDPVSYTHLTLPTIYSV